VKKARCKQTGELRAIKFIEKAKIPAYQKKSILPEIASLKQLVSNIELSFLIIGFRII
jgi:hypothetical protein